MQIKEIQEYAQIRTKARAYLCYILSRNISQSMQEGSIDYVLKKLHTLKRTIPQSEVIYVLDKNGIQITDCISDNQKLNARGKGSDKRDRAYYYKTLKEHRCILTDPYPSLISNELVVTATFPIYDEKGELLFIICVDISLKNILKMIDPSSVDSTFGMMSKWVYTLFSIALFGVAILLFIKGMGSFLHFGMDLSSIDINQIFKSTILLTLALAIVDLVKAIFEEEVLGKDKRKNSNDESHHTMVRFLGSIIIALSIETMMLVFKFALTDTGKLLYSVYLLGGISMLIIALSIYLKVNQRNPERKQ